MSIPFERSVTITRSGVGAYDDDGVWAPAVDTTVVIMATIQPDVGRSKLGVENTYPDSGSDTSGVIAIYSASQIIAADEALSVTGDRFTYDNELYEVTKVNHYRDIIPHYKGFAMVVGSNEP